MVLDTPHAFAIFIVDESSIRKIRMKYFVYIIFLCTLVSACGGGGNSGTSQQTRSFMMGTTPFFATPAAFPDWRFENLDDKDLLSIHIDDFLGVPWDQCDSTGCNPPAAWTTRIKNLASNAKGTGKILYLALSPLGGRQTLAPKLDANSNKIDNWAPTNSNGCYAFATDSNSQKYKMAYISYVKYMIEQFKPAYVSPVIEMNVQFTKCPSQKAAFISWYTDIYNAIKSAYPALPVFATFQLENMYGITEPAAACTGSISLTSCFDQRLSEALSMPGDRIAFSTYPLIWSFHADFNFSYPRDTFTRVQAATSRKIWIAETGWAAIKVLQSYPHGSAGSCGSELYPASSANDSQQENYLKWLLSEADTKKFEAVIWWLNRDYLDGNVASTCPCSPATSDTCTMADNFYTAGGDSAESALRIFGNMALRNYDGSPRPSEFIWHSYFLRPLHAQP